MPLKRALTAYALLLSCAALAFAAPAKADDPFDARAEQARLAERVRLAPSDFDATYRYVRLSTDLRDYEAAVGALERLLMFNPNLSRARKELGFLYARLGAYQSASEHLSKALALGELDDAQRAQIEAQLAEIERRTQRSRIFARLQVGLRAQSNANFFPANGLFQTGGVGVFSPLGRRSDVNAFELAQVAHDYDFENQNADVFETRASIYATQQFSLPEYNVALFSGSLGPRFMIPQTFLPGLSVKPYLLGAASLLGNVNYLNTGGGGVSLRAPIGDYLLLEPGFEWRALYVNNRNPFNGGLFSSLATLASGDVITGYVGGIARYSDSIALDWRAAYSRASAVRASQSSDQFDATAMLRLEVDPPHPMIGRRWTIAPFARYTSLSFDAANFLVDPFKARRDSAWTQGILLDAPVTANLGFSGHLEFSRNDSNIPNFKTQNVSVTFGPVARF